MMMVFGRIIFTVLLASSTLQTGAEKEFQVTETLLPRAKDSGFRDHSAHNGTAVHLSIDLSQQRGRYLVVESKRSFYLFINSVFVLKGSGVVKFSADSLRNKYSSAIFLSVYQRDGVDDLSVVWGLLTTHDEWYNPRRPTLVFSNFILIASLTLTIFFTALFRTNPRLTLDYLNFTKLFYLRDREENQNTLRITSSVNLLFYLFCSLLASLALIMVVHFTKEGLPFLSYVPFSSAGGYWVQWTLLALAILGLLMAKLAFVSLLAMLFGWRDVTGVQFFNFVRILILSLALIALVSLFCFSFGIRANYFVLLKVGCSLLIVGAGLLYFKLQARTTFRSFHLFSYLCATEIFPLVILIKLILF